MSFSNLKSQLKKKKTKSQTIFSVKTFFKTYINAIKAKKLFFTYPFVASNMLDDVLKCLAKNSRIAAYIVCPEKQNIKIFLNYDLVQNKSLAPAIIFYSAQGRTRSATVKMLQHFRIQNPHSFTLLKTPFGIMDLQTCLSRNCGGVVLLSLV